MNTSIHTRCLTEKVVKEIILAWNISTRVIQRDHFIRAWSSLAYLFPELHPDQYDESDGGWPDVLVPMAAEAWRRSQAGELDGDELYPSDAQWCGLYDRMERHTPEEIQRRHELTGLANA